MNDTSIRMVVGVAGAVLLTSCATLHRDATLSPSLESRLQALAGLEYGEDRAPAAALSDFLTEQNSARKRAAIEPRLVQFIEDASVTRAARQQVIRELGRVGTARSAPVLTRLLSDVDLGDDAAMALQRMTDPRVARQVLASLPSAGGIARERTIAILGHKQESGAVPALAIDAVDADQRIAAAAVTALGRIATPTAAESLIKVLPDLTGESRLAAWPALLACQEAAMRTHHDRTAQTVAAALASAPAPAHVLAASKLAELQTASPPEIESGVSELLASPDPTLQSVGAELARQLLADPHLLSVSHSLPQFPEASQIALLGILEDRGLSAAAPLIAERVSSPADAVRCAAIQALGHAGDARSVAVIAAATVAESDAVRQAADTALRLIEGDGIDDGLLELAQTADTRVRVEVLAAIGDRGMTAALPVMFDSSRDPDATVRRAAIRQLGALVGPADWPRLLDLLCTPQAEEDRQALVTAAGAAGLRIADSGRTVASTLSTTTNAGNRVALLMLAGRLGDDATLPELARAASDPDADIRNAALRALGGWKSPAALPTLVAAASGTDESSRRLAVRGALQVLRQAEGPADDDRITRYREIADRIEHPDDRRLLLSAVADLGHPAALGLAAGFLDDAEVRAEAEAAVIQIAKRTEQADDTMRAALQRIASESESEAMQNQAATLLNR